MEPCDYTRDAFPSDCDVPFKASNLPKYDRTTIAAVVAKAFDGLLPGGEIHLLGEVTNDERAGPWRPAYWWLGQAVSGSKGLAHSESDVIGYFEGTGFKDVEIVDFILGC